MKNTETASTLPHETLRPQYGVWALADTLAASARKAKRHARHAPKSPTLRPLSAYTVR